MTSMEPRSCDSAPSSRWESHWKLFRLVQSSSAVADEAVASACSELVDIMSRLTAMSASRRRHVATSVTGWHAHDANPQTLLYQLLLSKLRALCCLLCMSRQNSTHVSAATVCDMLSYLSDKKLGSTPVSSHSLELLSFACRNMTAHQVAVRCEVIPVLLALLNNNGADRMRLLLGQVHAYDVYSRSTETHVALIAPDIMLLHVMQFVSEQMPHVRYRTISAIMGVLLRRFAQSINGGGWPPLSVTVKCVIEMFLMFYIQHASIFASCDGEAGVRHYGSTPTSQPKQLKLFGGMTADAEQFTVLCAFPAASTDAVMKGYDAHCISQVCNVSIFSRFKIFLNTLHAGEHDHTQLLTSQSMFSLYETEIKCFFEASPNEESDVLGRELCVAKQLYTSFKSRVAVLSSLLSCVVKYCESVLNLCRTMANSFLPLYKRSSNHHHQHDAERDMLCIVAVHSLDCLRLILTSPSTFADDIRAQAATALDTFIDRMCFTQEGADVLRIVLHGTLPAMLNAVVSVAEHSASPEIVCKKSCADHAYVYRRIQTIFEKYLAVPDFLVIALRRWALFDACCKCVAEQNLAISYQPHLAVIIDHLPALFFALVCNAKLYLFSMLRIVPALVTTFPTTSFEILFDLILSMPLLAQAIDVHLLISNEALSASSSSDGAFATPALLAFRNPASSDTYAFMKGMTPGLRRFSCAVVALKTTEEFSCGWPLLVESCQSENELLKLEYRPRVADAVDVMPALLSKLLETVQQRHILKSKTRSKTSSDEVTVLVLSKVLDNAHLHPVLSRTPHIRTAIAQLLSDAVSNIISSNAHLLTASPPYERSGEKCGLESDEAEQPRQKSSADIIIEHISCQFLLESPPIFTALLRACGTAFVRQLLSATSNSSDFTQQFIDSDAAHRRFYEALESATYEIVRQNGELRYKQHLLNDEAVLEAVVALLEALAAVGCCQRRQRSAPPALRTNNSNRSPSEEHPSVTVSIDNAGTNNNSSSANVVDSDYARRTVICFHNLMQRMQAMPADDNYRATVIRTIESLVNEYSMPSLNDVVQKLASSNELQVEPEVIEALQRQITPSHSGEFATVRK